MTCIAPTIGTTLTEGKTIYKIAATRLDSYGCLICVRWVAKRGAWTKAVTYLNPTFHSLTPCPSPE